MTNLNLSFFIFGTSGVNFRVIYYSILKIGVNMVLNIHRNHKAY